MTPKFSRLLANAWLAAFFLSGCNIENLPDFDNTYLPDYEGEIALIIGKDTLTVGEFIKELSDDTTIVQETQNKEIYIVYEDSTDFSLTSDFVDVSSFSNEKTIESPVSFPFIPPTDTTLVISREINFDYVSSEGERLDSLYYESGTLRLSIISDFPGDVAYNINTNSFQEVNSGDGITISSALVYSGFTPISGTQDTDLSGYKTLLNFQNDSSVFIVNLQASVSIPAGRTLSGNESIKIQVDVLDPEFDAIYGSFGTDTFDIESQEISLDVFSEFSDTGLSFEAPRVYFTFENSFGLAAGLDFSNIYASYEDKPDMPLTGQFTENLQIIEAPSIEDAGSVTTSTITMTKDNSNINDILSSSPDQLNLSLVGISNPDNEDGNFLLKNSNIKIKSRIELPLSLQLQDFEYDTEFDLGDLSRLEDSQSLTLILKTTNELPIGGEVDVEFLNMNGEAFDDILNISILESPTLFDADDKTTEPSSLETRVTLDQAKISSLTTAEKLRVTVRFNSFGSQQNQFVKIFSDYSLITTIAIEGKVSINLNEN
ncbi:MAG: hypothetical protein RIA62_06810 [Cyclobacteriaceae bacterium]